MKKYSMILHVYNTTTKHEEEMRDDPTRKILFIKSHTPEKTITVVL